MSFNVTISSDFAKKAKIISKKHPGIKTDITKLVADLEKNPKIGTDLGQNFYKIRLSITGTNKGKSGGARVITYVIIDDKECCWPKFILKANTTLLILIYLSVV